MNAVQKQCRYFVVIHTPFEVAMGGRVILKKYIFYQCTCTNTFMHTNIVEKNLRRKISCYTMKKLQTSQEEKFLVHDRVKKKCLYQIIHMPLKSSMVFSLILPT